MSNAVTRFKTRQAGAVVVSVPWALGDMGDDNKPVVAHEFNLQINIFAQSELNNASEIARDSLAKRLIKEPSDDATKEDKAAYNNSFNLEYWAAAAQFIKRHVVGWEHTPKDGSEPIKHSKPVADALFSEMSIAEAQMLGLGYLLAVNAEQKKRLNPANTA